MTFWKSKMKENKNIEKHTGSSGSSSNPQTTKPISGDTSTVSHPPGLANVKNIIAIASGKGGVGKSTVATNLAVALKHLGSTVGLMDADIYGASQPGMLGSGQQRSTTSPQGNLIPTTCYGVDFVSIGLLMANDESPVVWRAPMAIKMIHRFIGNVEWGSLDYLLIDLPPGTGDVQLTLAQQAALTGAIIVSTPQDVALDIAKKGLRMFQKVKVPILGIVENMSGYICNHCGEQSDIFEQGGAEKMAKELGVPLLGKIPLIADIMKSGDSGRPILADSTESIAAKAYLALAHALEKEIAGTREDEQFAQPKEIKLNNDGFLLVEWPDGHKGLHRPYRLRINCACAVCIDENTGKQILNKKSVPLDIKIESFSSVGRYALRMLFSDTHNTGIYTFDKLRTICECQECTKSDSAYQEPFSV